MDAISLKLEPSWLLSYQGQDAWSWRNASQVFSLTFFRFQAMNIFSLDRNINSFAVAADVVGHQICCFYPYWQIRWRKMMHRRPAEWVKRSTAGRLENYKIAFCILRSNTSLASICFWGKPNYWKQRFFNRSLAGDFSDIWCMLVTGYVSPWSRWLEWILSLWRWEDQRNH